MRRSMYIGGMEKLIATFKAIGNLSEENEAALVNAIRLREHLPDTLLQEQGRVCNSVYFVEKGVARTFYYKDGKDVTHWIATEGDFVGSMASFFMRTPSNKMVATIEWKWKNSADSSLSSVWR